MSSRAPDVAASAAQVRRADPWSDLVLTLPMFVGYHLGIIFLPIRNAADVVTRELVALSDHNMAAYGGLTLGIGLVYVFGLGLAGRGHALHWQRFAWMAAEGVIYAVAMRLTANYVVGRVFLGDIPHGAFAGTIMSLGAGFYEELVFRVVLFGLGLKIIGVFYPLTTQLRKAVVPILWAVVTAGAFSAWHYVGELGEPFQSDSFLFRWVCGLVFVLIYRLRGFAPVVWTHTVYDFWVMVL
ncbi:MAG TPA: CPBP family intramembrane glutamic endopeptidase [Polyangiaceae bacterium]|nr:CPBP family intramembrane glutamic endopeptidase [Polyangiaceae bacterium]